MGTYFWTPERGLLLLGAEWPSGYQLAYLSGLLAQRFEKSATRSQTTADPESSFVACEPARVANDVVVYNDALVFLLCRALVAISRSL